MTFEHLMELRKKYREYSNSVVLEYTNDVELSVDTQVYVGEISALFTVLNRRSGNCQCTKSLFEALDVFVEFVKENG